MWFIGIDPGVSGGLAWIDADGTQVGYAKMPDTEADLWHLSMQIARPSRAVLERVHGGIGGPGGRRQGAAGMFTYGRNYGSLLMLLTTTSVPFDTVPPQQWQKIVGVTYPTGATQTERKNISKRRAQQLFPALPVTHAIADALLLAECCRRLHAGVRLKGWTDGKESEGREDQAGAGVQASPPRTAAGAAGEHPLAPLTTAAGDGAGPRRRARSALRSDRGRPGPGL